jgi:threonine dehydrogenase-like Zn-dependent dehydrogenase
MGPAAGLTPAEEPPGRVAVVGNGPVGQTGALLLGRVSWILF